MRVVCRRFLLLLSLTIGFFINISDADEVVVTYIVTDQRNGQLHHLQLILGSGGDFTLHQYFPKGFWNAHPDFLPDFSEFYMETRGGSVLLKNQVLLPLALSLPSYHIRAFSPGRVGEYFFLIHEGYGADRQEEYDSCYEVADDD